MKKSLIVFLLILSLAAPATAARIAFATPQILATAGVASATPTRVGGLTQIAVQTTGIGSDVFKIQVSLNNADWEDLTTISANGIVQIIGVYDALKIVKVSGSGTTAQIILIGVEQ